IGAAGAFELAVCIPAPQTHDAATLFHYRICRKSQKCGLPFGIAENDDFFFRLEACPYTSLCRFHDARNFRFALRVQLLEVCSEPFRLGTILCDEKPERETRLIHA